ncbi:hypothetical protein AJ85_16895 [Alkalihalobacillus alcalophilus ATCC 27647 = CGMCC 1.3604]|uniref:Uncharacterized protein n=1 Tax=Alkalihalobacillus alcalophilus ATCC 27647 = CGMCC 1.3604 TaxID=1218173 RepID=A0A4S4K3B8_ALKAL|nr:hypothetical protein AJ85_16895 [Alkalihalobacillus alcalophilus ATCC 27647 = CGMCC 1.3604]
MLSVARVPIVIDGYGKGNRFVGNFSTYPLDWTGEEAVVFGMLPKVLDPINHLVPPDF